jgi:lysozyme family protein
MKENFDKSFSLLLKSEGGWTGPSGLKGDPGGETNYGVTKRVWEAYVGHSVDTLKDLTPDDVKPLYQKQYWNPVHGDELPIGLDFLVFSFGVNAGTGRSVKVLQSALGIVQDGALGPNTLKAIQSADSASLIEKFSQAKINFYQSLPTFATFGKGWTNRVNAEKAEALGMLNA